MRHCESRGYHQWLKGFPDDNDVKLSELDNAHIVIKHCKEPIMASIKTEKKRVITIEIG